MSSHATTPPGGGGGGDPTGGTGGTPPPAPSGGRGGPGRTHGESAWAAGGTLFAAVLMLVYGILGVLQGIAAIAKDDVYARIGDYVYEFDGTSWGWIHLALGVIVAATGGGILRGSDGARVMGVVLVAFAVVVNFVWLPYQPVWAVVDIAIGVFVIWALCTDHDRRVTPQPWS